ncbi:hypothetical protein WJX79_009176, partial [Trebouxia sp. C0005]
LPVVGEIEEPGFLEGGDYFAAGEGPSPWLGIECTWTVFSAFWGDKCCIMLEEMLGAESKTRRLVDEYSRHPSTGKYEMNPGEG